jgi:aryl-alcohol dehydrogenase-like predicted oxidoreductase
MARLSQPERELSFTDSKFGMPMSESRAERGASRGWIVQAAEDSLRRLQTDYIDLYQIHAPDPETPIDETVRALVKRPVCRKASAPDAAARLAAG